MLLALRYHLSSKYRCPQTAQQKFNENLLNVEKLFVILLKDTIRTLSEIICKRKRQNFYKSPWKRDVSPRNARIQAETLRNCVPFFYGV